mmetsp:Transcript_9174/g.19572  ORF Transcript_9174/g.19572 Transcript_9174/m.19572 type:complete len:489 (+) Transcript_9174:116-1582(+)
MTRAIVAQSSNEPTWPPEIEATYERIRPLGKGAFGTVWLAKDRNKSTSHENDDAPAVPECATDGNGVVDDDDDDSIDSFEKEDDFDTHAASMTKNFGPKTFQDHPYVAIKQIKALNKEQIQYAGREIDILSEIRHPNVIQCLYSVPLSKSQLVVMSLAYGPNLGMIVREGGALSTSLARLAARHLVAAVSYLHGRGVIHRDIKDDNLVLTRPGQCKMLSAEDDALSNDSFWDDKATFDEKEWKVVLVDFGFAKALTPTDVGNKQSVMNLMNSQIEKQMSTKGMAETEQDGTKTQVKRSLSGGKVEQKEGVRRLSSFQKFTIRSMSALGTRAFAAPEIVNKVREKSDGDVALSQHVADYGLISDAYSVGCTIKVLLTGVPADVTDVMAFIGSRNNLLVDIILAIFACGKKRKRKKRYKFLDETPKPARELIGKLMKPNIEDRLTVPSACDEPWIKGGVNADDAIVKLPEGDVSVGNDDPIICLKCAGKY